MNRDFKGVWIPKEVWINENLTWMEKLFYVEIDSLDNDKGCFASNKYFSNFFKLTPQRCSQIINQLIDKRMLSTEIIRDGERIVKRTLRVVNKIDTPYQESLPGYQEKVKDNNTVNNTILSEAETLAKESRKALKELFFGKYNDKAFEIKKTRVNSDGKRIAPQWTGKEAKLLKADTDQNGASSMEEYIDLFFSDKVKEVKDFCRGTHKAGYGYSVFHGMIGKLVLAPAVLPPPCPVCGERGGHKTNCCILIEQQLKKAKERDEIMANRGDPTISITSEFKKKIEEKAS